NRNRPNAIKSRSKPLAATLDDDSTDPTEKKKGVSSRSADASTTTATDVCVATLVVPATVLTPVLVPGIAGADQGFTQNENTEGVAGVVSSAPTTGTASEVAPTPQSGESIKANNSEAGQVAGKPAPLFLNALPEGKAVAAEKSPPDTTDSPAIAPPD